VFGKLSKKLDFVSPELHWNFDKRMTCLDTILSGYFDTPGLYRKANSEQQQVANDWLTRLGLAEYAAQRLSTVSSGIQRMLLLLRALVKNPPLFILDEPCQGLDDKQTANFVNLIDDLFANTEHTIIYVSHREDQIPSCISHSIRLDQGKVITQ
jgi:ABC-type molybdenum transport system, ATPase component/photorepair protein PhrA